MDAKEAEAYGISLTKGQKELLARQHKYALIGQHLPVPDCGCGHARCALGACTHDCEERRRILVPTVIELAPEDAQQEMEINQTMRFEISKQWLGMDRQPEQLPRLYGWAVDMPTIAFGNDCGCALTGVLGCGCDDNEGIFFSPYGAIPLTEDQALAVLQAAHRDMPASPYWPLSELVELENHGLDYIDDIEWNPDSTEEDIEARYEEMRRPLVEAIGGATADPGGHVHIDRRRFSYEIPDQALDPVTRMVGAEKRALASYKNVFRRSPHTLRAEARQVFAYPCE